MCTSLNISRDIKLRDDDPSHKVVCILIQQPIYLLYWNQHTIQLSLTSKWDIKPNICKQVKK